MDAGDLEGMADAVCALAGVDDEDQLYPSAIAKRLFGPGAVVASQGLRARGRLSLVDGLHSITVRASLRREQMEHTVGHELGHWILRRYGVSEDPQVEIACDFIGAALVARRGIFRRAYRTRSIEQLAFDFGTTETLAALRIGETIGTPIAVISPQVVRVRGDVWEWPSEIEIRRGAPTGLKKTSFRDDPKRFALTSV